MKISRLLPAVLVLLLFAASAHAFEARVVVSSFKPNLTATYVPGHLMDNDPSTAWVSLGDGAGESVTVRFGQPVRVVRLGIFNGAQGTGEFGVRNRIAKGCIVYGDGFEYPFELEDIGGEQVVKCDSKEPVTEFEVVVDEVVPKGKKYEFRGVAVSEIKLYLASLPPTQEQILAQEKAEQDKRALDGAKSVINSFLVLNTRLDEEVLLLYPSKYRKKERMNLYLFQEYQKQLKTYEMLRAAQVDVSGIEYDLVSNIAPDATVHAVGNMVVTANGKTVSVPVDSDFFVKKYEDEWKILRERPRKELNFNQKAK